MNILQDIIAYKKKEVAARRQLVPIPDLEGSVFFSNPVLSLKREIVKSGSSGIIAEFKRRSPSAGVICADASVAQLTTAYYLSGACALSVLTDQRSFGGCNEDLTIARRHNACPILRKDFIIDEYQVIEARSIGADAILLIAAVLSEREIQRLSSLARQLQMEVLLEVHSREELDKISEHTDIIGVNNRDLRSFETNYERSLEIKHLIPPNFTTISESGIHHPEIAYKLRKEGFDGFLIGEAFMRHIRPENACENFIRILNGLEHKTPTTKSP